MTGTITAVLQNLMGRKIFKFAIVAVLATLLNYLIFFVGLEFLKINYLVASATGFITSVLMGYQLNTRWTFNGTQKSNKKMVKYYTVYLFSLAVSLLFLNIFVERLHLDAKIANLLCICITFCTNYTGTKFWVFKK